MIEISNGFRAWGVAALLFALAPMWYFVRYAIHRAFDNCEGVTGHIACAAAFLSAAWSAGNETTLRLNAWSAVGLLAFVGIAGGSIFLSSAFMGGYDTTFLNIVMLPMWALVSAAAWGVAIETAGERREKRRMGYAAGLLLVVMMSISLSVDAQA